MRRRRTRCGGAERGSVTAEFAVVLPAVVVVLVSALSAMQVAGEQVRLQAAAADAARMFARDDPSAAARVATAVRGATVTRQVRGDLVCAEASAPTGIAILASMRLEATSCALGEG